MVGIQSWARRQNSCLFLTRRVTQMSTMLPHKTSLRPVHLFTGKLPITRTAENQTGLIYPCFFTKKTYGEGGCERPFGLLASLSPKECRVAWAYFIASYRVSLYCTIRTIANQLDHEDGHNTLMITLYLPCCSSSDSCMVSDIFSHADQDDDGTPSGYPTYYFSLVLTLW